jgi:NTP pyrophosphatase (non-canonical NTP hydrolase)
MSLKQNQKEVDDWIGQYKLGYFKPLEILARLTEEVGEVARELNHMFGPKKKKPGEVEAHLEEELADVIYTVVCLANSQKIDLDKAWKRMMAKYNFRDKDRWEKK